MKKLFLLMLATGMGMTATAQTEINETPRESIVVGRYTNNPEGTVNPVRPETPVYKKIWFGFDAGYSYRVAKVHPDLEPEMREVLNKMRGGKYCGADIHFAIAPEMGLGIRYTWHQYTNSLDNNYKVVTNYFAPSFQVRSTNFKTKNTTFYGFSLGVLSYREKYGSFTIIEEVGYGSTLDFGHDFYLSDDVSLGIKLTLTGGIVDLGGLQNSLSAIDLGMGLRF